jgi:hypothetical protein
VKHKSGVEVKNSLSFTSTPHTSPSLIYLGALSLGVKRPEREADHSPPSSAEVKE